jgi:hypothetical protein
MIFIKSQAEMEEQLPKFLQHLAPAGVLWVSWPKKTSGLVTDLNEDDVRRIGLTAGLVDVKICAVSEVWSGLKFVIRVKDAQSSFARGRTSSAIKVWERSLDRRRRGRVGGLPKRARLRRHGGLWCPPVSQPEQSGSVRSS